MGILDSLANAVGSLVGSNAATDDRDQASASDAATTAQNAPAAEPVGTIRVQYYRSAISTPQRHKQIVRSFGITKLNQIVERPDTNATRGAVRKVPHLLRIVG